MDKGDFYWTAACLLLLAVANKLSLDIQRKDRRRIAGLEADVAFLQDWAKQADNRTADM